MFTRATAKLHQANRESVGAVVYLRATTMGQPQISTFAGCPASNLDWEAGP